MKKATLTKLLALWGGVMLFLAPSCSDEYDDSGIRKEMEELAARIEKLEEQAQVINIHLRALDDFIEVMRGSLYIAKVEKIASGFMIYFTNGETILLENGKPGDDAPTIGVKADADGIYYWTITSGGNTEWLTDGNGDKLRVSAVTPTLGVDSQGYWTISYDGGKTATRILDADGKPVEALGNVFENIELDGEWLNITLGDGTTVSVPVRSNFYLLLKDAPEVAKFYYGQTLTFETESVGVERVVLNKPDEWKVSFENDILSITAPTQEHASCAELAGEVSIIYFSANHLSTALTLKVVVEKPKTITITVTDKGLNGDEATISAQVTPSDEEFVYHIAEFKAEYYPADKPEDALEDLLTAFNMFVESQGWESAEKVLLTRGTQPYTAKWLALDTDYYLAAFGIEKKLVDGKPVGVATTPIFLSEKVHTPGTAVSDAIDLSATATANSYIVDKPNTKYRFKATVMGNGRATTGITPAAIDPKLAFLVWETGTVKNAIIKDVVLTGDGYIEFTTGEKMDGNALIAVTDNIPVETDPKLGLGTILWSWHIWATDYNPSMDRKCVNFEQKEFTIMDRNLGEWSDKNASYSGGYWGLKYQWGRKDPFISFTYSGVPEGAALSHHADYPWESDYMPAVDTDEKTIGYAVQYPAVFFRGSYANDNDWYGVGLGVEHRNNNLWGNADGTTAAKTIYDPCPVGYKVAPLEAFSGFFKTGLTKKYIATTDLNVSGAFAEGWNFITEGTDYSFFPASGSLTGSTASGTKFGTTGLYHTSDVSKDVGYENQVRMMRIESTSCYLNTGNRGDGASVRCVRE